MVAAMMRRFFGFCCWQGGGWICSDHMESIVSATREKWAASDEWQADWRAGRNCAVPRRPLAARAADRPASSMIWTKGGTMSSTRPSPNSTANCSRRDAATSDLLVGSATLRHSDEILIWRQQKVAASVSAAETEETSHHSSSLILLY